MIRITLIAAILVMGTSLAAGEIRATGAFVPLPPPGARSHAAYMTLVNSSDVARHLIGVTADGYAMAHLHSSETRDGVATMVMVQQLEVAPGATVALVPGGLHIMLMGPAAPVKVGDCVALRLAFADGQTLAVTATVKARENGS